MNEVSSRLTSRSAPILLTRRPVRVGAPAWALAVLGSALAAEPVVEPPPRVPEPPAGVVVPTPALIRSTLLVLITTPPNAVVTNTLTGQVLGRTPLELHPPSSSNTLEVQFMLEGFVPQRRSVRLDEHQHLELSLTRTPKAPAGTRRALSEGVIDPS